MNIQPISNNPTRDEAADRIRLVIKSLTTKEKPLRGMVLENKCKEVVDSIIRAVMFELDK